MIATTLALFSIGLHTPVMHPSITITRARTPHASALSEAATKAPSTSDALVAAAEEFINTKSGFYSPYETDAFAEDFVFRGPVIGPLNKKDYLYHGHVQGLPCLSDISPNAFAIDPMEERRVWFFVHPAARIPDPLALAMG